VRAVHCVLYLFAASTFVAPAAYLIRVWPHKAPPAPAEVNRAHVEANSGGYNVVLPDGTRYQLLRSDVNGATKRRAALALVRSQLTSEYSSYRRLWARFWFLLAGACGVAMLLTLISSLIHNPEWRSVGAAHP